MKTIDQINAQVELHDLAARLNLHRPGSTGNYKSPHHKDKNPSLSIFERDGSQGWKDHSNEEKRGGPVQLVMYVQNMEIRPAIEWLHRSYGWPLQENRQETKKDSKIEWKAKTCLGEEQKAIAYLASRGIPEEVSKKGLEAKVIGHTSWCNPKVAKGKIGHNGPAVAFIVKSLDKGAVVAVDLRFTHPDEYEGGKRKGRGKNKLSRFLFPDIR